MKWAAVMAGLMAWAGAGPAGAAVVPPALTAPWGGAHGLPRVRGVTAAQLETEYAAAIETMRSEIRAIANNPAPPSFENSVLALERSGDALERVHAVYSIYTATKSDDSIRAVAAKIAPLRQALDDEVALDPVLFARVEAVYRQLPNLDLSPDARRLTEVIRDRMLRRGARLDPAAKSELSRINAELAGLQQRFAANVAKDEATRFVEVRDEDRLAGMDEADRRAAKAAAIEFGKSDSWVIRNSRPAVWSVAKRANDPSLRADVWRMWMSRGTHQGETDNAPVASAILKLRGQKAKLFGKANYAELAFEGRMVPGPRAALDLLTDAWEPVASETGRRLAAMSEIARADGLPGPIAASDYLYYAEKLKQARFGFDSKSVEPYLQVARLLDAMMWAAERTYGVSFKPLPDVDVVSPDIRVFEVKRDDRAIGFLYVDLFRRDGKQRGSWASQYRAGRSGSVLPVVALHSNAEPGLEGAPATVDYEVANVLFHEFGHALHFLANSSPYAATGPLALPWDFVETPSLLNERWLLEPATLSRLAIHSDTGEPMPVALAEKLRRVVRFDRVFSVNLDYLATALTDLRLHMMADGREIDVAAEEAKLLAQMRLPGTVDPVMRALQSFHSFAASEYAAGVYTYLWSDMLAADLAEAFVRAPGGFFDEKVAKRYYDTIMSRGARVPASQAFRDFRGRDPEARALMRRFDLGSGETRGD
ncbi:M3 family metallopeptidase [Allosphingosinicella indica]|uniref:Peptidyl-dipeptidase Dcp n=1 Tax=Allosphingosinicella indica TaxID=941907 RepID=A0A1X7FYG1_9SPHN|nr:M3 family metallopeptidase [Allosphingosinicella indica]SMF61151.1 peptidyl-dipeptidase Dcp [Allosphingosinicella indica]